MDKNNNSPVTTVRLDKDDQKQMKFIREKLSAPGMDISKSDVLRRALHEFANTLRAQTTNKENGS